MGTFGLKAVMGMYFAFAIPLLASSNKWVAPLLFLPVGLSMSTGALLGGLLGYLFYLWNKAKRLFFIMLVFLSAGIAFVVFKFDAPMGMFGTRPPMWGTVLHDCFRQPVQGYGLDSFRFGNLRYYKETDTDITHLAIKTKIPNTDQEGYAIMEQMKEGKNFDWWDNPHNEYLQLFFEFGLVGVLIIGFILYSIIERFRKSYRTEQSVAIMGVFIVLLVSSLVQFPFHLARIAHLVPIMLALFMIETERPQIL
jgi:O-antigen ligase